MEGAMYVLLFFRDVVSLVGICGCDCLLAYIHDDQAFIIH